MKEEGVEMQAKLVASFHSVKITDSQPSEAHSKSGRSSNAYIVYAILAALLNAFGQIIRGYESGDVVSSNILFSASWLIVPISMISYNRHKAKSSGETFLFPWQLPVSQD